VCANAPDYRGRTYDLRIQRELLTRDDRVLLVDDWAERGSQARAARTLVEACNATLAGVALVVDQLDDATRGALGRVDALVHAAELGPSA
jgi:adenine phosphoribosyltransferase